MKKLTHILIPILFLLLTCPSGFCLDATALVSTNEITTDGSVILRITIEGGKADIDTSVITDFRVESRGSGTNVSIVNGDYSRTTSYTYLLFPLKKGLLTIPEITVTDGSKTAKTEKITINVSEEMLSDKRPKDFFATATVSDSTLFIGQDAVYTFKFFSSGNTGRARLEEHNTEGFSEKMIGKQKNYRQNINGIMYTVNELNYLITPESEKNFTIGPTSVIAEIDIRGNNFDSIDSFFSSRKKVKKISSNSLNIKVSPIPEYNGSENYTGLVGNFNLNAEINKTEMKTGESATLSIIVSGSGNIMDTSFDHINLPEDSFNIYDDQPEKQEELTSEGYFKKKIFKKAIVPLKAGSYTIPEISLIFFDTASGEYKKISTEPVNISVSITDNSADMSPLNTDKGKNRVKKEEVKFTGRDILPLKQGGDVLKSQRELNFFVFISLVTIPFILFLLVKLFTIFREKDKADSVIMKQRALEALKKAKRPELSNEKFLIHIRNVVVSSIFSKGNMKGEALTKDEACAILQNSGLKKEAVEDTLAALNEIDSAKYSGESLKNDKRKELLIKAKHIIKLCSFVICMLSFSFLMPLDTRAESIDESGTLFLEGVKNYRSGEFLKAADNFEKIALNGTISGELYYNTANAYLKAGEIGKAILWYERAKKLIPLDADLKFNLDYAREKLQDINEEKGFSISDILFFWKDYAPSDRVSYSAVILSFIFFLYASIRAIRNKKIFTSAGYILSVLFLLVLSTAMFDYYKKNNSDTAVIIPPEISVRSGFSENSTELFRLHAGTKVKIDRTTDEFLKISFTRDKLGWVKKGDAEKI